jgi:2-polyprenyl-3-methyl-5-hydroxy-6-metoxy-1,4-benzoquinol methylase
MLGDLKNLKHYSNKNGLPIEVLAEMYKIESKFHAEILAEAHFDKRQDLYSNVYNKSAELTEPYSKNYFDVLVAAKKKVLKVFKKEVIGKSVLDIGSGSGAFLYSIAKSGYPYKSLFGLDVKAPTLPSDDLAKEITCYQRNVIDFEVPQQFEIAILDNVYEHIAPADKDLFLKSITKSIEVGGKLILLIPNKLFGPSDWTVLKDNTFSGKIEASCLHLDEITFSEVITTLTKYGFANFKSPIPFIVLYKLNQLFPNFRLPSAFYAFLEDSWLIRAFKNIKFKGKSVMRMEVSIIAERIK